MRFDLRLVLVSILGLIVLSVSGCVRSRVTDTSDVPSLSVAPASAAEAQVSSAPDTETAPDTEMSVTTTQGSASVSLNPSTATVNVGESVVVDVLIDDVTDLFGADVRLKYDPSVLEVVDANTLVPDTQIESGNFPDISSGMGFVAQNVVDLEEGTIGYATTLLSPAEPVSGSGTLASITFRGKTTGNSDISFTSILLSDSNANQIPVTKSGASLTVVAGGPPAPSATPEPTATESPTPATEPTSTPVPSKCTYIVEAGDTLFSIARRFGTTVSDIAQTNGITNVNQIEVGQKLVIPDCETDTPPPTDDECTTYVIQRGDTLFSLAQRFNMSVSELALQNNIVNPSLIFVGQRLTICPEGSDTSPPEPPTECTFHTVAPGDTLFSIALSYGSTVQEVARANNITNVNVIFVGQKLCVPK